MLAVSFPFQSAEQAHRLVTWGHPRSSPSKRVPLPRPSSGDVYTRITITSLTFTIKDKCHRHKIPIIKSKVNMQAPALPLLAPPERTQGRGVSSAQRLGPGVHVSLHVGGKEQRPVGLQTSEGAAEKSPRDPYRIFATSAMEGKRHAQGRGSAWAGCANTDQMGTN